MPKRSAERKHNSNADADVSGRSVAIASRKDDEKVTGCPCGHINVMGLYSIGYLLSLGIWLWLGPVSFPQVASANTAMEKVV